MFLLNTVKPGEAAGQVAEAYKLFPPPRGVPLPFELLSASPGLLTLQAGKTSYFRSHPQLSAPLLAAIRYVAAVKSGNTVCTAINSGILARMGASADSLDKLASEEDSVLEPREAAMLAFVTKTLEAPGAISAADIEALRERGYADSDIFDAVEHATTMVATSVLFKAFVRE